MDLAQRFCSLSSRLRSFFHPHQMDQELKEELREHLEQQIKENLATGMSAKEARRTAMRDFGGLTQIEQQCRDAHGASPLEDFVQDLRYGFRQLRRSPGFSSLAILCLTLGIGSNAAVFSWVEGIFVPALSPGRTSGAAVCRGGAGTGHENRFAVMAGFP